MVGNIVDVWFWRTAGAAMVEAYQWRMKVSARLVRFGPWPAVVMAFGVPFVGGTAIGLLTGVIGG